MFVDNSSFILHLLVEKLIKDSKLWDRLKTIDRKNNNKSKTDAISYNQFEMNLFNAMIEINNITYLAVMDNRKNVAFISENGSTRAKTPVYVNLRNLDGLFLRPFIIMNGYFLINNHKELYKKYNKSIIEHGLNIEIDFSDLFYSKRRKYSTDCRIGQVLGKIINEIIGCEFLTLYSIEKCTFWFKGIYSNVNFDVKSHLIYFIHFEACTFEQNVHLPENLKKLWIMDSQIVNSLILPIGLAEIYLEKVNVKEKTKLEIGKKCQVVSLKNINGDVNIPSITENFSIQYCSNWELELKKDENDIIVELHIVNVVFKNVGTNLCYDKAIMTLEDVTLSNGCTMLLHKHITKAELKRFTGLIQVSNIVRNESCVIYLDSGTCQLQRTDEGNVQELTLLNADLISTTTTTENQIDLNDGLNLELSSSIKKICLKNCFGALLFEDWPIFRKIVFEQDNTIHAL